MDQCTHKVRAEHWKGIIEACSKHSDDQSVKSWLDEKGICEQSYYYWQRKLRRQAYELMQENQTSAPEVSTGTNVAFVEVPYVQPETIDTKSADSTPAAVIRTASAEIEIFNDISETLLACILKEVSHA